MSSQTAPRADARRNIQRILDAAELVLGRDPAATMSEIAAEAGLGRVTVYGHFQSRSLLIEAVIRRSLTAVDTALRGVDLSGEAAAALERLVDETWQITANAGQLLIAAEEALPPSTLRELHTGGLEERVRSFIARAQSTGEFRADVPTEWFVATFHAIIHAAPNEIYAGRLARQDASRIIYATLLGAFQTPVART